MMHSLSKKWVLAAVCLLGGLALGPSRFAAQQPAAAQHREKSLIARDFEAATIAAGDDELLKSKKERYNVALEELDFQAENYQTGGRDNCGKRGGAHSIPGKLR
jgi:hypothetical protein